MKRKQMREQVQKSLNAELSGLRTSPLQRDILYQNAVGGYKVKRKLTVGWVLALTLMLATVTAVAAILLSGKDFVNQYLAPMSQQTEDEKWTDEEMKQILMLAEENGVEITEGIREALESSDPVYKEELLRMFMKIDLGFYPATWPLEEQAWYDELLYKYGMKEEITRFLPIEGEISEQEALDIAEKYVLENWSVDISKGQYTRYVQYMLSQDDESGAVNKRWDIEYEAEDGTMYVLCLTPEGLVIEDVFSTYVHKPRNVVTEKKEDVDDDVWELARLMMDDRFYTVETLARFQKDYAELIEAVASSNDQQVILMRLLLEIPYAEPRETDISPEEAFVAAQEAARIAGWNDDWLERCKYSVSYRDYDDAEPMYRICFKLRADQRDLFYSREMPFGIVIYINPINGEVISINELNELDEYDRYCEFPDPHDSYDSSGNG